ncbi:MAG: HAMP domain-containing histidine kinase [Clostridia bacterium]|nr:HAMP domain-containing histidine kinase [Clostridia bacterium]
MVYLYNNHKKRKWRIKTHLLVTLIGLTTALLLTVALAFNVSMYGYIRGRLSEQLSNVSGSASEDRIDNRREPGEKPGEKPDQEPEQDPGAENEAPFDEHPDRIMGTRGSAVLLNADGTVFDNLHGEAAVAEDLAEWYRGHAGKTSLQNKMVFLKNGTYMISVRDDPVTEGQILLSYVDVTSIMAFTSQINIVLLTVILAAILICILLSRRFARSFAEPVQSLSDFAAQIGSGDTEPQALSFRDVEFDALADSMNRMASDLRESQRKQEVFFQNVSHELRTPLTSIRGNAEGIVYGLMEPQAAAKVILSESDKLGGLVEDILFLSRAGKEKPDDSAEPLDMRDVISLCVSEQRTEAENKGVSFVFDFDDEPVELRIREQDAERMIGNLISNAIRYAEKTVTLRCRREQDAVVIEVKDDGPGVAEEDFPHVFERMYKGKGGKHGIGLAIARAAAKAAGGEITVRNENGAVFEARFPAAAKNRV